jgi:hypothetical protein
LEEVSVVVIADGSVYDTVVSKESDGGGELVGEVINI